MIGVRFLNEILYSNNSISVIFKFGNDIISVSGAIRDFNNLNGKILKRFAHQTKTLKILTKVLDTKHEH